MKLRPELVPQLSAVYLAAGANYAAPVTTTKASGKLRYLATDNQEADAKAPEAPKITYKNTLSDVEFTKLSKWMSTQKEDRMKFWLRVHESQTFAFSISFFLFIQRGNR